MPLTRKSTLDQLKRLRKLTKGKDIGDLTVNDRLNKNLPNIQYIGNPIDKHVDTYEEFSSKDNKLQTIAFKSKLVNKKISNKLKENNINNMKSSDILKFENFELNNKNFFNVEELNTTDEVLDLFDDLEFNFESLKTDHSNKESADELYDTLLRKHPTKNPKELKEAAYKWIGYNEENIQQYKNFVNEEKKIEYTLLGEEEKIKSDLNFGVAAVKDQQNKKIAFFNNFTIDPPTPSERQILNAGQYVDNKKVKGQINRIEGKDVYVEMADDPMVIKKFNIKDVI